jgi:uncharacterized protein (DUF885 family)
VLLFTLRSDLFSLERRDPFRNPQFYVGPLALTAYISRPYAKVEERARGVIAIARASRAYLAHADRNLEPSLPRPWLETALKQLAGMVDFVQRDVEPALPGLPPALQAELHAALTDMASALGAFVAALQARLQKANDDYALGEATFLRMLEETQGVRTTLADLERVGNADLARNLSAIEAVAREIDPRRNPAEVIAEVVADKPEPGQVLAEAGAQAVRARAFLVERELASIPLPHSAEVRETPPFLRYNLAFLDGAGPFEKVSLPSFYYISPPDPSWPEEKQRQYVPDRGSLLSVTVHELWPGHFLHSQHMARNRSRILRSFRNYAMSEGWAHYAEEMMWQEGFSRDAKERVGQLLMALHRNVRFVCAIGLHARGMTVAQAAALFRDKAFMDEGNAQQQADRGTFDPMYLSYTLGKLMILKLREDYRAQRQARGEPYSLLQFHDAFLSYGAAPIPLIRAAMLGPEAGPPL